MAFYSPHWKDDVAKHLSTFTSKAATLAEEFNDPYSIEMFTRVFLQEYEKFLIEKGPMEVFQFPPHQ